MRNPLLRMVLSMSRELEEILQHAGVKGMKWGIRKKRELSPREQKAQAEVDKRKGDLKVANRSERKSAKRELGYAKDDYSKAKILDKIDSKPKSDYQLKMEDKYKKQGMNNDEAAIAAYKNIRTKKALAIVGGITLAAAGAYAGYKINDTYFDKVIKAGSSLQNVAADSDKGVRDAFYASNNKLDKAKYKGMYAGFLEATTGKAFNKDIKVLSDIKQASPKNAHKALADLMKNDKEFASGFETYLRDHSGNMGVKYASKAKNGLKSVTSGKVDKNAYEVFNAALADHTPEMQKLTDKYFKAMNSRGYNAIKDVNDSKYSGYKSLNPLITFGANDKVKVVDVRRLADDEIGKNSAISMAHVIGTSLVQTGAVYAATYGGVKATKNYVNNQKNIKAITKYREENPGTKLSNTEITRMLERGVNSAK